MFTCSCDGLGVYGDGFFFCEWMVREGVRGLDGCRGFFLEGVELDNGNIVSSLTSVLQILLGLKYILRGFWMPTYLHTYLLHSGVLTVILF